jgi:hypothetical protein
MHVQRARWRARALLRAAALGWIALGGDIAALAQAQPPGFMPQDESPEQFPDGPNREDAFYRCTACHGFRIVAAQGMSRSRWDESLNWMTERHNMPKLEGEEREKVLDYLEHAFPEQKRAPGGWRNPFAPQ